MIRRRVLRLSQQRLAAEARISYWRLNRLERGLQEPRAGEAEALLAALDRLVEAPRERAIR